MFSGLQSSKLAVVAVVLLGFLAYLPALNNPFIADDYAFFWYIDHLQGHWPDPAFHPAGLGFRRLASTIFFFLCYKLFGFAPAAYYLANLMVHLVNSGLVGLLALELTQDRRVAFVAALFFVAFERHEEAVFWISAHHELFVSLGVLSTVWFFLRYRRSGQRRYYVLALGGLAFSALTKESFIVVAPLLVLLDLCFFALPSTRRWIEHAPFLLVAGAYAAQMFAVRSEVSLYTDYYAITPHFFVVFANSLNRLLQSVYGFLILAWWLGRSGRGERFAEFLRAKPTLFLAGWMVLTLVPYSFATYVDQLPSRHTYLPSVGTAGLVALLFVWAWDHARSQGQRFVVGALLGLLLTANVAYLWWWKDAQYLERAAPTEELIALLNREMITARTAKGVAIYDFPYVPIIGQAAARYFTSVDPTQIDFLGSAQPAPEGALVLRWDRERKVFQVVARPHPGSPKN